KAVHPVEIGKAQECLAREDFEAAAGVARAIFEKAAAQPIGEAGGITFRDIVLALEALAHHEAEPRIAAWGLILLQELGDLAWRILPVTVEHRDCLTFGLEDAGANGRTLAAILRVPNDPKLRHGLPQVLQHLDGRVLRAVID